MTQTIIHNAKILANKLRNTTEMSKRLSHTEQLWQYRTYQGNDPAHMIDWKQSARLHNPVVREHEPISTKKIYFWIDKNNKYKKAQELLCTLSYLLSYKERSVHWISSNIAKSFDKFMSTKNNELLQHNISRSCIIISTDFENCNENFISIIRSYISQGNKIILVNLKEIPESFSLKLPSISLTNETKPELFLIQLIDKVIKETK